MNQYNNAAGDAVITMIPVISAEGRGKKKSRILSLYLSLLLVYSTPVKKVNKKIKVWY